ncbi:MAG: universal stress protein [Haloplanus sp.]
MTFVVPFDGSDLASAALARASEFGDALDQPVLAVTVVPTGNAAYARERGWLGADEPFDVESVVASLRDRVATIAPDADFEHAVVERYASSGTIAREIRTMARREDASMVFVGSEHAGNIVSSVSSVGGSVSAEHAYDVVVVLNPARSLAEM